ncbi:DinB family protein [Paenibacillus segetis]|uniref:DinB-like domain-containing protein n=1 Tax=Paenibacillus segetis TaxID=1325360 RepID=A0ABQ1Y976_9BACL|nr:DinB family protein [Paenibacillus segetis]GGH16231.1 hypothetical protein GCM10008013_10890 [Paenibacillus segetis]
MTYSTILPLWNSTQDRFHSMVKKLPEQDLTLQLGPSSIGNMLRHNAEVEYMVADWFFGRPIPGDIEILTSRGAANNKVSQSNLQELIQFLEKSNTHLIQAMEALPEEEWNKQKECPIGASTPLEAVGRLMYHAGIHAGQISLIQKCTTKQESI